MIHLSPLFAIPERYLNRHGMISGATGSGKSVTLMRLAEECQRSGIPVIMTDVKGDLSTMMAEPKEEGGFRAVVLRNCTAKGAAFPFRVEPVLMGPALISRMISATHVMANAIESAMDGKLDIGTMPKLISAVQSDVTTPIGTRNAIVRRLQSIASRTTVIGENLSNFYVPNIWGGIRLIECTELFDEPRVYGAVMLHILDRLFREMPEVGDLPQPKVVLIVDEAHLLFDGLPDDLLRGFERILRLVRSRGVAVWFATQNPQDMPTGIAAQLATQIVHGMRIGNADAARKLARNLPPTRDRDDVTAADILSLAPGWAFATTLGDDGGMGHTVRSRISLPSCPLDQPQPIPQAVAPVKDTSYDEELMNPYGVAWYHPEYMLRGMTVGFKIFTFMSIYAWNYMELPFFVGLAFTCLEVFLGTMLGMCVGASVADVKYRLKKRRQRRASPRLTA